jgi:uncharacterized membrane protein
MYIRLELSIVSFTIHSLYALWPQIQVLKLGIMQAKLLLPHIREQVIASAPKAPRGLALRMRAGMLRGI